MNCIPSRVLPKVEKDNTYYDPKNPEISLSEDERQPCEVFSRVMGYLRPVTEWNIGKRQEYADRVCYDPEKLLVDSE